MPIESNIAAKFWVSASSDSGDTTADLARDDNLETAWAAVDNSAGHWLMLDLGGTYDNLRKVEVIFPNPNAIYRYILEASGDGKAWDVIADQADNGVMSEGFIHLFTRSGTRFIRLTITEAPPRARPGIKELRVFNYLREDIVNGADMSYVDQYRLQKYYLNPDSDSRDWGPGPNVLDVVKDRGMKFIRIRIWNEPRSENSGNAVSPDYCSPGRSFVVAKWIKGRGLQLGIDFHYADSWADPGKQPKPEAWAALEFDELVSVMEKFTFDTITRLVEQGTTPDKVAVGNEIINGFLWGSEMEEMGLDVINPAYVRDNPAVYLSQPGGGLLWKYWRSQDPIEQQKHEAAWDRFATLVAAGIGAVRQASPETAVEIHVVSDQDKLDKTMEFWGQLLPRVKAKGADPDVLALSYYPEWHGTHQDFERALYAMASTYPQYKINVSETAYPAEGGSIPLPNADQPLTVQGQANMLRRTIRAANDVINNQGTGVLVWEPQSFQPMFTRIRIGDEYYYTPYASMDVFKEAFARNILEHNVYVTTTRGEAPTLPETVQMLMTGDGSIQPVSVTWQKLDPSLYQKHGSFTLSGETEYGSVTAWVTVLYRYTGEIPPRMSLPADTSAG